jgi:hypothetical protein
MATRRGCHPFLLERHHARGEIVSVKVQSWKLAIIYHANSV